MRATRLALSASVTGLQVSARPAQRANMPGGMLFPEELFTLVGRRHLDDQFPHQPFASPGSPAFSDILPCRTVYYTVPVGASASRIEREVMALSAQLSYVVEAAENASRGKDDFLYAYRLPKRMELLIVDEADRLKMAGLEQLRDLYDRGNFGMVLIGMPGLEKRLARSRGLWCSGTEKWLKAECSVKISNLQR
jgi:AAA domain